MMHEGISSVQVIVFVIIYISAHLCLAFQLIDYLLIIFMNEKMFFIH
jgi:hypothetical protein